MNPDHRHTDDAIGVAGFLGAGDHASWVVSLEPGDSGDLLGPERGIASGDLHADNRFEGRWPECNEKE
jgi:hypothetical protein